MSEETLENNVVEAADLEVPTESQQPSDLATDSPSLEGEQDTEQAAPEESESDRSRRAINKKHRLWKEEQERREALERENQELRAKYEKPQTPDSIEIPPMPDAWDDNFDQKMQQRDAALREQARLEAIQQNQAAQQEHAQRQQQLEQEKVVKQRITTFEENAAKLNVSEDAYNSAIQTVVDYGISPDVANYILENPNGPLMIQHLASDTLELDALSNMSPMNAAVYLEGISKQSESLKPKQTSAPPPAENISGRGAPPEQDEAEAMGITFSTGGYNG